jgi:hypothetical protein
LCSDKGKISGNFCFERMDLGIFDKFCPSLKTRAQLEERRYDMNRSDKNSERYVIPMHRKNFWTNKWMQDPRKNFLQVYHYDPSAQYRKGWGSFKRKRGLTLCYNCRRPGHLAKECPGRSPIFLCCKATGHEVLDFPRMIAKVEKMNMRQEDHEEGQETKNMLKNQKESEAILLQMKETLNDHRDISLSEILKEKECIETRIGDFDIDCVLDAETQVNIMTESTWEILGKPAMIPSLGGIGLFKGKLITLCGRLAHVPMVSHGTSTEEEFEVIKFVENNTPFALLLGKTWIERDQIRRREEEEAIEQKKKELRDFMAKRIARLIKEQEDKSKQLRTRDLAVEVERTQEGLKNLSMQESRAPTPETVREEVLSSNLGKDPQQCEVTMLRKDKNKNGKRNPETQITGKKARKLSKKKEKLEKLQEVPERTSQKEGLQNLNLARIAEQHRLALHHGEAI